MANKWMEKLTKEFGVAASDLKKEVVVPIPTWSPSLNWALTTQGWVPGKVNVLYGPESCGKSMISMMGIVQLQRMDKEALSVWFDSEFSFNAKLFEKLGGDLSRVIIRKSNDPVKIFDWMGGDMLEALQDGAPIKAIVIDSIKSIRFPKDIKKISTNQTMGGTGSSYLPSAFKMIIPIISEFKLLTFLIQQVTAQIDPMKAMRNPYIITEGYALKHNADLMLEIVKLETKSGSIESGETISGSSAQVGHKIRVKVKKNRLGPPSRQAQFTFHYDLLVIKTGEEIYELAKAIGVINKKEKGNSLFWKTKQIGKGDAEARATLESSLELQKAIIEDCYNYKNDKPVIADESGFVDDAGDDIFEEENE
jgi:recombination protein RecA